MESLKITLSALKQIIEWSSSRYNEMKKKDVINDIIFRVEKGCDCKIEYRSGCYSEKAHQYGGSKWTGGNYTLEICKGRALLTNSVSDSIPETCFCYELHRSTTHWKFYQPALVILHLCEKYGVPQGEFEVIDQDISCFHVMFEGMVRFIEKRDCAITKIPIVRHQPRSNDYIR